MNKRAFTLVELVATIVILGIILMIAVPSYTRYIEKSKESKCKADERAILDAAESFVSDCSFNNKCSIERYDVIEAKSVSVKLKDFVVNYPLDDISWSDLTSAGISTSDFSELNVTDYDAVKMIIWKNASEKTIQYVDYDNLTSVNLKKFDSKVNFIDLDSIAFSASVVDSSSNNYHLKVQDLINANFINSEYEKYKDIEILVLNKPIQGISEYTFILKDRANEFGELCK